MAQQHTKYVDVLEERYEAGLKDYLQRNDESCLLHAYQLGRESVQEGRAILEMLAMHQVTLRVLLKEKRTSEEVQQLVERSCSYLAEAIAPYEMTNRAFHETHEAWEQMKSTMESAARNLAHLLHDDAGQILAAVHISLDGLASRMVPADRERIQEVRLLLDKVEDRMRSLSHEMRSPVLDEQGLLPALHGLAFSVTRRTGVVVTVDGLEGSRLPEAAEAVLYRVVQEALHNVTRHAGAKHVHIHLWRPAGAVCCSIEDDGSGFQLGADKSGPKGLGLLGIKERLQGLQGDFEIHSESGKGTRLNVRIPLED